MRPVLAEVVGPSAVLAFTNQTNRDGRELLSGRAAMAALVRKSTEAGVTKSRELTRLLGRLPSEYAHLSVVTKVRFVLPDGGIAEGITPEQFADS